MAALFISDLHLSPQREDVTGALLVFLHEVPRPGDTLYVLGDLFDYWIGDDDADAPLNQRVASALAATAARGVALYFMHGNRDVLLGAGYAGPARLSLLPDPYVFNLHGVATVLQHGDLLCTDDHAYQAFRRGIHAPGWIEAFLARPLAERKAEILRLRAMSEDAKAVKAEAIMDVNEDTVRQALSATGAVRMIHGHTHRPGRHDYLMHGQPKQRWVLPAWDQHAGYLRVDAGGVELIYLD
jgi:UDP-2,3-diacylglucosamine hydrolase